MCDLMDIIFIFSSHEYLPHKADGFKLLSLLKYVSLDKKPVICTGCSIFSLIYNLSTNFDLDLNIINITKDFKTIEDLDKIPIKILDEINPKDRFFDYATGDLYQHIYKECSWKPLENVGYHSRLFAAKFSSNNFFI